MTYRNISDIDPDSDSDSDAIPLSTVANNIFQQ